MLHCVITGLSQDTTIDRARGRVQISEVVMDMGASSLASFQHPPTDHNQDPIWNKATLGRSLLSIPLHVSIRCQITAEDSIYTTE